MSQAAVLLREVGLKEREDWEKSQRLSEWIYAHIPAKFETTLAKILAEARAMGLTVLESGAPGRPISAFLPNTICLLQSGGRFLQVERNEVVGGSWWGMINNKGDGIVYRPLISGVSGDHGDDVTELETVLAARLAPQPEIVVIPDDPVVALLPPGLPGQTMNDGRGIICFLSELSGEVEQYARDLLDAPARLAEQAKQH